MAWNKSGVPKKNAHLGNKKNNDQESPNIDKIIKSINSKVINLFGKSLITNKLATILLLIIAVIAIGAWAVSGIDSLNQGKFEIKGSVQYNFSTDK